MQKHQLWEGFLHCVLWNPSLLNRMRFFLAKLSLQFQIKVNLYLTSNLHVTRIPFVFTVVLQSSGIALSSSACKKLSSRAMYICFLGVCLFFFPAKQFLQSGFVCCLHAKQPEGHHLGLCQLSRSFCKWIPFACCSFLLRVSPFAYPHASAVGPPACGSLLQPPDIPVIWHLGLIAFWILQILNSDFKRPPVSL